MTAEQYDVIRYEISKLLNKGELILPIDPLMAFIADCHWEDESKIPPGCRVSSRGHREAGYKADPGRRTRRRKKTMSTKDLARTKRNMSEFATNFVEEFGEDLKALGKVHNRPSINPDLVAIYYERVLEEEGPQRFNSIQGLFCSYCLHHPTAGMKAAVSA